MKKKINTKDNVYTSEENAKIRRLLDRTSNLEFFLKWWGYLLLSLITFGICIPFFYKFMLDYLKED